MGKLSGEKFGATFLLLLLIIHSSSVSSLGTKSISDTDFSTLLELLTQNLIDNRANLKDVKASLDDLQATVRDLSTRVQNMEGRLQTVDSRLDDVNTGLQIVNSTLIKATAALDSVNSTISIVTLGLQAVEAKTEVLEETTAQHTTSIIQTQTQLDNFKSTTEQTLSDFSTQVSTVLPQQINAVSSDLQGLKSIAVTNLRLGSLHRVVTWNGPGLSDDYGYVITEVSNFNSDQYIDNAARRHIEVEVNGAWKSIS